MKRLLVLAALLLAALALVGARPAHADGSWMDQPLVNWNTAGAAVPAAPAGDFSNPRCGQDERPVETAEDQAVSDAGWTLFGAYQGGWGITLISGLSGYDGMCRPFGYQFFVFVNGAFAGTISPEAMNSRFDGSATIVRLVSSGRITAQFSRYSDADPLCCPSRISFVTYGFDDSQGAPLLAPLEVSTQSTQSEQ
ncbi:MAG TPA: LppP/LprE family lipoprotein [Dehalococcoidia bacterium]|nr:LppP/LprE family lipoprotein [Dehalococcoidia bacterium]